MGIPRIVYANRWISWSPVSTGLFFFLRGFHTVQVVLAFILAPAPFWNGGFQGEPCFGKERFFLGTTPKEVCCLLRISTNDFMIGMIWSKHDWKIIPFSTGSCLFVETFATAWCFTLIFMLDHVAASHHGDLFRDWHRQPWSVEERWVGCAAPILAPDMDGWSVELVASFLGKIPLAG